MRRKLDSHDAQAGLEKSRLRYRNALPAFDFAADYHNARGNPPEEVAQHIQESMF